VREHQRAALGLQLLDDLGDPAGAVVVGVQHPQVRGGAAQLVGGAGDGGLAGARFALQDQPLAVLEVPVHGLAALRPAQAGADRGGQHDRRGQGADWVRGTRSGAASWTCSTPPAAPRSAQLARPCTRATAPLGRSTSWSRLVDLSASMAPATSAEWSAGSISSRARSFIITRSGLTR
jgi:hypothetical protein